MMNTLNQQQALFVKSDIEQCRLIGNPGCGKTRSIIEFVIDKYKNKCIKTSTHFMIITFSKMAQQDFLTKGKLSSNPKLFTSINVRTIHSIASSIYKKLFNGTSISINTIILATLRTIKDGCDLNKIACVRNCKFIIVDEAQDISKNQYCLINEIVTKLNIPLILVGDPNQNIFQFQGGTEKYLMEHTGSSHTLISNYRSTNEIINFINVMRPHDDLPEMISANNTHGPKPIIFNGSIEDINEYILKTINNCKYNLKDVAIIGPIKRGKTYNNNKYTLSRVSNLLSDNNIGFVDHYTDNDIDRVVRNITRKDNCVNIMTCHGSKGLEFEMTIVIGYHFKTMNRVPTYEDYNRFKYLWYVALSRAKQELIICVEESNNPFPELTNIDSNLFEIAGTPLNIKSIYELRFNEHLKQTMFTVCDVIRNNEFFNEERLLDFEQEQFFDSISKSVQEYHSFELTDILDEDKYCMLYGLFIEQLFMLYYYQSRDELNKVVEFYSNKFAHIILLDKSYSKPYMELTRRGIINSRGECDLDISSDKLNKNTMRLINYCKSQVTDNNVSIFIKSDMIAFDKKHFNQLCNNIIDKSNKEIALFEIVLYLYQIQCEKKYILKNDFTEHVNSLSHYFDNIYDLATSFPSLRFQQRVKHPNINIVGIIDAIDETNGHIIELKFTNDISLLHKLQTILYYNCLYPDWSNNQPIEILNLKTGEQMLLTINSSNPWYFNVYLCDVLDIKMDNNVFLLDIETNTINEFGDPFSPNNTEIIDRYVYEYNFKCAVSDGLIRNNHPITNANIHGIEECHINMNTDTINNLKHDFDTILNACNNPIFIGHNGKRFDIPVLEYHEILYASKDHMFYQ